MKYCVLDLETSVNNVGDFSVGDFAASPFCLDNRIVALGAKFNNGPVKTYYYTDMVGHSFDEFKIDESTMLIGQNIKFDLLYLMRYPHWREWMAYGKIFDTALAEYILTGQEAKYVNLDTLSKKYGGKLKPDMIKKYWENGISTEDIPKTELIEYLVGDVTNTEIVALRQLESAKKRGLINLLWMEMRSLLATTEMEFNGLYFDKENALAKAQSLSEVRQKHRDNLTQQMKTQLKKMPIEQILPTSSKQLSVVLFGGKYKYEDVEQVIDPDTGEPYRYKTGKKKGEIKTRKIVAEAYCEGFGNTAKEEWATKVDGVYSTAEEVLKKLDVTPFLSDLFDLRTLEKDINTYYLGYSDLVWHDGCIHGKIDHVGTNTGRFNSSKPNLQNITGKE